MDATNTFTRNKIMCKTTAKAQNETGHQCYILTFAMAIPFRFVSKRVFMHTQYMFTITLYANQYKYSYKSNIKRATFDRQFTYAHDAKFDMDSYQGVCMDQQNILNSREGKRHPTNADRRENLNFH